MSAHTYRATGYKYILRSKLGEGLGETFSSIPNVQATNATLECREDAYCAPSPLAQLLSVFAPIIEAEELTCNKYVVQCSHHKSHSPHTDANDPSWVRQT